MGSRSFIALRDVGLEPTTFGLEVRRLQKTPVANGAFFSSSDHARIVAYRKRATRSATTAGAIPLHRRSCDDADAHTTHINHLRRRGATHDAGAHHTRRPPQLAWRSGRVAVFVLGCGWKLGGCVALRDEMYDCDARCGHARGGSHHVASALSALAICIVRAQSRIRSPRVGLEPTTFGFERHTNNTFGNDRGCDVTPARTPRCLAGSSTL